MSDILDEATAVVQCKECPWYKSCVMPMRFTLDDIRGQLPSSSLSSDDATMSKYFAELAAATQNFLLEGCPVFIQRLRASPKLAERIKKMMQSWGGEEEPDSQT
ncbi:MAG: hypothetical protein E3J81_05110 [Dehalococcoidia bacterium]|nr:MAG: hypothetical protein E3J81_05110 [Dehalococcoidia bacterium]